MGAKRSIPARKDAISIFYYQKIACKIRRNDTNFSLFDEMLGAEQVWIEFSLDFISYFKKYRNSGRESLTWELCPFINLRWSQVNR